MSKGAPNSSAGHLRLLKLPAGSLNRRKDKGKSIEPYDSCSAHAVDSVLTLSMP
jgi:hypothetical protein